MTYSVLTFNNISGHKQYLPICNCRRLQWMKNLNIAYVKHTQVVSEDHFEPRHSHEGTFAEQCCSCAYKYVLEFLHFTFYLFYR